MEKINFANYADINASNVKIEEGQTELPAGTYNVVIEEMGITPSKSDGFTPVFKTHFRVLNGTFANSHLFNNQVLIKRDERDGARIGGALTFLRSMGLVDPRSLRWVDLQSLDAQIDQLFSLIQKSNIGFSINLEYKSWKNKNGETVNFPRYKINSSFSLDAVPPVYDSNQQQGFSQQGYAQQGAGFSQPNYAQQAPVYGQQMQQPVQQQMTQQQMTQGQATPPAQAMTNDIPF